MINLSIETSHSIWDLQLLFKCLSQVSFNPQDNTQLCVVGNTVFRHFRYSEGNLKPFNFQKMEPQNYLCHAWVSEERIIVGTDNGKLLLFEAGEVRNEFNLAPGSEKWVTIKWSILLSLVLNLILHLFCTLFHD